MSIRTRRDKRKKRAETPIETDWLWSCPPDIPLNQIARILNFTDEPKTELSARFWADDRRFREDIYRALFPPQLPKRPGSHVVWDALDENLQDACVAGRLIVIRDLPVDLPHAVQMLIGIIGSRRRERGFHFFESRPGARFALVLEGWALSTIRVRFPRGSHVYMVTPLGSQNDLQGLISRMASPGAE